MCLCQIPSMATKDVRVRHNGREVNIQALVLDDPKHGGDEVFRQMGIQLELDPRTIKVVHRGKLLKREDVCEVLRADKGGQAVVQVIGTGERLAGEPLGRRLMGLWLSITGPVFGFFSTVTASEWWAHWWAMMIVGLNGVWEFFRTFMPGHVPKEGQGRVRIRPRGGDPEAGNEEPEPEVRVQRRVDTGGRNCRDEINMEAVTHFRRQDPR